MVRRVRRGVDELHAVLPGRFARRLCVRALAERPVGPHANDGPCGASGAELPLASDSALPVVEAAGSRRPASPNPGTADRNGRSALFSAGFHKSPAAIVVFAIERRGDALPLLRPFECGLDARPADVSGPGRTIPHKRPAGMDVVDLVYRVCSGLRDGRAPLTRRPSSRNRRESGRRRAALVGTAGVDGPRGCCVGPAAGGDEPPDAECRGNSVSLGASAQPLSAEFHSLLRQRSLVQPMALHPARARWRCRRWPTRFPERATYRT